MRKRLISREISLFLTIVEGVDGFYRFRVGRII